MPKLHYLIGDATEPVKKPAMIFHCCNSIGGWNRGFVIALREKFPESEKQYREWFRTGKPQLGETQFVQVTPDICVANMIGQKGTHWEGKIPPIRYDAIEECLKTVYSKAQKENLTVHGPRIGAVLAGGEWPVIEKIIKDAMTVETYVYTLEKQKDRWKTIYEE
jgi:O-acetyl-ADP-ribose deacetylase (regulator of RNase III)